MAQTGFSPILLYSSSTASSAPTAGNLTNSTTGSELAINITDGKLFYKDNSGVVQVIGWKTTPTSAGGTGLTTYTAGDLPYYASGTALSKLGIGSSGTFLTSSGTAPQWSAASSVAVTSLSFGSTGLTPSTATQGAITVSGTLAAANGGTGQSSYTVGDILYASSTTALSKLSDVATGNALISGGTSTAPSWGKIGLTTHVSGTLPTGNGGTGLTSFTANGVVYASSTSALTTNSAFTFDGTNLAISGTTTSAALIPSGSTVPTNGLFLPSTNTVGFSTNSTQAMQISSTGGVSIGNTTDPGATNLSVNGLLGVGMTGTPTATIDARSASSRVRLVSTTITNSSFFSSENGSAALSMGVDSSEGLNTSVAYASFFYSTATTPMIFFNNSAERMRIDSSGNLLLGNTGQTYRLSVAGSAASTALSQFYCNAAGDVSNPAIQILKSDNNTTTSQKFITFLVNGGGTASGQINANGASSAAFGSYSDERLKENIQNLPAQLDNIKSLRPVEFDYKDGSGHQIGFIAQEMQQVYPDVVGEDSDGMLTITGWSKTEARLVKALQELNDKFDAYVASHI